MFEIIWKKFKKASISLKKDVKHVLKNSVCEYGTLQLAKFGNTVLSKCKEKISNTKHLNAHNPLPKLKIILRSAETI